MSLAMCVSLYPVYNVALPNKADINDFEVLHLMCHVALLRLVLVSKSIVVSLLPEHGFKTCLSTGGICTAGPVVHFERGVFLLEK